MLEVRLDAQRATVLAHGLDGIGEDVAPGLLQQAWVCHYVRTVVLQRFLDPHVVPAGQRRGQRALHGHGRVDERKLRLAVAADLQEVLHQVADARAFLADHAYQFGLFLRRLPGLVEQRGRGIDHADRVADLVRQRRRQFAERDQFILLETLLLRVARIAQAHGHGIERLGQIADLIIADHRHRGVEILRGQLHDTVAQQLHRAHDQPREEDAYRHADRHAQQGDGGE